MIPEFEGRKDPVCSAYLYLDHLCINTLLNLALYIVLHSHRHVCIFTTRCHVKKVQVGNDQKSRNQKRNKGTSRQRSKKSQSEKDSISKNRGGKKLN